MSTVKERQELLAWQLKQGRRYAKYSRTLLAQESGIDAVRLAHFEEGSEEPTLGELYTLAELLGLPMSDLIADRTTRWHPPARLAKIWQDPKVMGLLGLGALLTLGAALLWLWLHQPMSAT